MPVKILIFFFLIVNSFSAGFPYYYYDIKNSKMQKKEFIKLLLPLVQKSDAKVRKERKFVKNFFENAGNNSFREISEISLARLISLYKKYKIHNLFDKHEYLKKIDVVPVSLAIAQAAAESGWGKSRFVLEANNIFGEWTYSGNGIVPIDREEGKTHTLRIFKTLQASVDSYVLNLNRHKAYRNFRAKRERARKKEIIYNGLMAAKTMLYYSQRRGKYVRFLENIIKSNNLLYYDRL